MIAPELYIPADSLFHLFTKPKVYDYGDECQEEEINIVGLHNWFLAKIYDPSVRTVVILSSGMFSAARLRNLGLLKHSNHQLMAFLLDQLLAVSLARSEISSAEILVA